MSDLEDIVRSASTQPPQKRKRKKPKSSSTTLQKLTILPRFIFRLCHFFSSETPQKPTTPSESATLQEEGAGEIVTEIPNYKALQYLARILWWSGGLNIVFGVLCLIVGLTCSIYYLNKSIYYQNEATSVSRNFDRSYEVRARDSANAQAEAEMYGAEAKSSAKMGIGLLIAFVWTGILTLAAAQLLHCVRDMAINSFYQRHYLYLSASDGKNND